MSGTKVTPPGPTPNCPQCGTPLPRNALAGLCPACLLKVGAAADTITEGKQPPFNPPSLADLAPIFPQLEILSLLGKGGMGAVYKARQKQLDRIVALKILPPGIGNDPAFAERFAREAKALAKLNHPGIVTLYEFGQTGGTGQNAPLYFFLMEFVDGMNLRQLLHAGRVSAREALAIVPQICDALQFAHDQGIVHRDIKPENILLDRRGRVKVADFGLAKIVEAEGGASVPASRLVSSLAPPSEGALTDAGKVMGTPHYMSPEQIQAPGEIDHRADIYALGVVFYQMLTGELPGQKIEAPSKKVHIDVRLDEVVLRALAQKPELRYQQASALKTQIETIVESASASGRKPVQTTSPESQDGMTAAPSSRSGQIFRSILDWCWGFLFCWLLFLLFTGKHAPHTWLYFLSNAALLVIASLVEFFLRRQRIAHALAKQPETFAETRDPRSSGREEAQREKPEITGGFKPPAAGETHSMRKAFRHAFRIGVAVWLIAVALATLVTFLMHDNYRATARVRVELTILNHETESSRGPHQNYDPYFVQTEFETIQTEPVLEPVIQTLKLVERWGKRYGTVEKITNAEALARLKARLDLHPVRNTSIIDISVWSESAPESAELANAVADSFSAYRARQLREFEVQRNNSSSNASELNFTTVLSRVEIMERAQVPLQPARPNRPLNIVISVIVGAVLGAVAMLVIGVWKRAFWINFAVFVSIICMLTVAGVIGPSVFKWFNRPARKQDLSLANRPGGRARAELTFGSKAERVISTPPFIANYPGGTIELVAVAKFPETNAPCWLPDGSPSRDPFPEENGRFWVNEKHLRLLAVRIRSRDREASPASLRFETNSPNSSMGYSCDYNHPDYANVTERFAIVPGTQSVNFQIGVADGDWKTVSTLKPGTNAFLPNEATQGSASERIGDWQSSVERIVTKDGSMTVSFSYSQQEDYQSRMVAVRADGSKRKFNSGPLNGTGGLMKGMATFTASEAAGIVAFESQRRPYQWVEFRNVSVQPDYRTTVTVTDFGVETKTKVHDKTYTFGPVVERTLPLSKLGYSANLNLDSDEIQIIPETLTRADWSSAITLPDGIIVVAPSGTEPTLLVSATSAQIQPLRNGLEAWDSPATNYWQFPAVAQAGQTVSVSGESNSPPPTFAFHTLKGNAGLLQITGCTKTSVKIRYKLLQKAAAQLSPSTSSSNIAPTLLYQWYDGGQATNSTPTQVPLPPGYQPGQPAPLPPAYEPNPAH